MIKCVVQRNNTACTSGEAQTSNSSVSNRVLYAHQLQLLSAKSCADPEGVTGGLDPLKNHKNIRFLSNTGPGPLKNNKATKPAFNVGPSSACQRNAI